MIEEVDGGKGDKAAEEDRFSGKTSARFTEQAKEDKKVTTKWEEDKEKKAEE